MYSFYTKTIQAITIKKIIIMSHYQLRIKQFLKTDIDTIWDFASSPANLKEITPDYMLFNITSKDLPDKMYPGMIIATKFLLIKY